jgi:hypothetical protein
MALVVAHVRLAAGDGAAELTPEVMGDTAVEADDFATERARLTAPVAGVDSPAHAVTLRVLAERPDDPQVQKQWAGRLQGMAMAGLVWRFPGKPWRITRYGRALLDAEAAPRPLASLPPSVRDELECDIEDLLIDAYGSGATSSLVDAILSKVAEAESADRG